MKRLALTAVLTALLPLAARAGGKVDKKELAEHIRETYDIPGDVEITIGDLKASEIPSFQDAQVKFQRGDNVQLQTLHLSSDGRHYIVGTFKDTQVHPNAERLKKMNLASSPVRGNPAAGVTLVEYTDFECPFCQRGYEMMVNQIMKEYGGKVRWFYKSLPLTAIHPWAEPAAIAAECAHQQGVDKFWKLHDALFEGQKDIKPGNYTDKFKELAGKAGVDEAKFDVCTRDEAGKAAVERDLGEAEALGLNGTPAFLVNGRVISGADYEGLKRAIDDALKAHGGT